MRTFILYSRKAKTSPDFNLKDLPGSGGRMDNVCRFVTASLWISYGIRRDVIVYTVLNGPPNPPVTIEWSGEKMKRVSPDERSIACWIKKALEVIEKMPKEKDKPWYRVQEGIRVSRKSFQDIVKDKYCYVLEEKGKPINDVKLNENPAFVIGDHLGLPKNEERFALRNGEKISLGKEKYFSSACATILNWIVDKEE